MKSLIEPESVGMLEHVKIVSQVHSYWCKDELYTCILIDEVDTGGLPKMMYHVECECI